MPIRWMLFLIGFLGSCSPSPAAHPPEAITPSATPTIYRDGWIDFNKNSLRDIYEDREASLEDRIEDLLAQMTLEEKTCQLATLYGYQRVLKDDLPTASWADEIWKNGLGNLDEHLNGIPEWRSKKPSHYTGPPSIHARALNEVQRWFVEQTRLGVPVDFTNEGIRGLCYSNATNFPAQVGIGATWNPDLVREIGQVTGSEAAAAGYTNIYSPILDLSRDPRWGRVVECYGEDPHLVSRLGVAQAIGLREAGVASTAKHFVVYSVPKGGRDGNARTDPHVGRRELYEMHLAPFEAAIQEADLLGVMCSYNDFDGTPVSASRELLTAELRQRMGFRGYVVSDSGAVEDLRKKHRVSSSDSHAAWLFIEAGGNVRTAFNPPNKYIRALRAGVESGSLPQSVLDDRVRDVLRVKFLIGLFDMPFVESPSAADSIVGCEDHAQVALEAARQSLVLLKNEGEILPLSKDLNKILVCGPNAASIGHSISRYGPVGGEVISVIDGMRQVISDETEIVYALGCEAIDSEWPTSELFDLRARGQERELIDEAVTMAQSVDAVVLVLGDSEATIGESKSRTSLRLTGHQRELAQALHATGKPMVVVLINGRALAINWVDRHVPGIMEAWFPGQWCGRAVAEALFGDYNPGGKLPVTFPRTVGQLPLNFPYKVSSHGGQGKGHNPNGVGSSRVTGPLYPFGHGLSYTDFAYSELAVTPSAIDAEGEARVMLRITNVGDRAGDEVVQLYLRDRMSDYVPYDSVLRGFQRVHLKAGQSEVVTMPIDNAALAVTSPDGTRRVEPGEFGVLVGSSSQDIRLRGTLKIHATRPLAAESSGRVR